MESPFLEDLMNRQSKLQQSTHRSAAAVRREAKRNARTMAQKIGTAHELVEAYSFAYISLDELIESITNLFKEKEKND